MDLTFYWLNIVFSHWESLKMIWFLDLKIDYFICMPMSIVPNNKEIVCRIPKMLLLFCWKTLLLFMVSMQFSLVYITLYRNKICLSAVEDMYFISLVSVAKKGFLNYDQVALMLAGMGSSSDVFRMVSMLLDMCIQPWIFFPFAVHTCSCSLHILLFYNNRRFCFILFLN